MGASGERQGRRISSTSKGSRIAQDVVRTDTQYGVNVPTFLKDEPVFFRNSTFPQVPVALHLFYVQRRVGIFRVL